MYGARQANALRRGRLEDGRILDAPGREELARPYLPVPPDEASRSNSASPSRSRSPFEDKDDTRSRRSARNQPPRKKHSSWTFLRPFVDHILYLTIQLFFSLYIRTRQTYHAVVDHILAVLYYHHRTPELIQKDLKGLSRLPNHLSVIVELQGLRRSSAGGDPEGLSKLIEDVSEISAWCACAGIPMLSVYEQTGILKSHIPALHTSLTRTFRAYFPPPSQPTLHIRAPNHTSYSPPSTPLPPTSTPAALTILLLSAADGRATLVDLTKTLAEMSQRGKLHPSDISADLVDAEIAESSCAEPDLLVVMAPSSYRMRWGRGRRRGSRSRRIRKALGGGGGEGEEKKGSLPAPGGEICLRGYPPWQVRLTEIFHVQDNSAGVGYQVFLRALYNFAKAEMRFGR